MPLSLPSRVPAFIIPRMPSDWLHHLAGRFLVFDGPDGSGKSTMLRRFADHCTAAGLKVCEVREPGGTQVGEQIRRILLDPASEMSLRCEMLLYMASRAQLVEEVIAPALARREFVLADRFISSTLAYQGAASGLPVLDIMDVGRVAIGHHWPDLIVIFDVDEHTAAMRMAGGAKPRKGSGAGSPMKSAGAAAPSLFADRLELRGIEYQRQVRQGYLAQAHENPGKHVVIDASAEPDAVFDSLLNALAQRLQSPLSDPAQSSP
jgi:dTMP kinase